jgi:hypothetical protein
MYYGVMGMLLGRLRSGGSQFKGNPEQKVHGFPSQPIKNLGIMVHSRHPRNVANLKRRITVLEGQGINTKH